MIERFLTAVLALALAAPPAPSLPAGVSPLPEALGRKIGELLKTAEQYRGLPLRRPVPSGSVDEATLRRKMVEEFQRDLPPAKSESIETALHAFGLLPEGYTYAKDYVELLTAQVGGFYDPDQDYLALVRRDLGEWGEGAEAVEEGVLIHELVHALQDQHFDLGAYASGEPLQDGDAARIAVIEGDATRTMFNAMAGSEMDRQPATVERMQGLLADPRKLLETAKTMPGLAALIEAPAWFRDGLIFSYFEGFVFCSSARAKGGRELIDRAFTTDPPRSTEQILHPEKWHTKRDDPVAVALPDLAAAFPGYSKAAEAQLGELGVRTLMRQALKDNDRAAAVAAGWGGDRFAVFRKDAGRVLVWVTEWDSDADAAEFLAAARQLGPDWTPRRASPKRVVVTRGVLGEEQRKALGRAL